MIRGYNDNAATRTFVTWVRPGITVIAFGSVIDNCNLFRLMNGHRTRLTRDVASSSRLWDPLGRYHDPLSSLSEWR